MRNPLVLLPLLLLLACSDPPPPEPNPPLAYLCSSDSGITPYRDDFWTDQHDRKTPLWSDAVTRCQDCPDDPNCGPVTTVSWLTATSHPAAPIAPPENRR